MSKLGVEIATTNSFLVPTQSPATIEKLDGILKNFSSWEMAGTLPSVVTVVQMHC